MVQNIALIVNPNSANGKALQVAAAVKQQMQEVDISFNEYLTLPDTLDDHDEAWIIGGDGSLNYFINRFPNFQEPIVIFKGGTGNDFATKLYGNISPAQQARNILSATPQWIDAGMCNDKLFLNGIGIGFDGVVLNRMHSIRNIGGHLGYLVAVLRSIFTYRSPAFTYNAGNRMARQKLLLFHIFNSNTTGGGFIVAPNADVQDGLLDITTCRDIPALKRLINLPKVERGQHLHLDFIEHFTSPCINIQCEKEVYAQIDGDLFTARDFKIEILPSRFLFRY